MVTSNDILSRPTLVLNRSWQPIHVTTVVRSLVMLWNDAAKVVDPADYRLYSWTEWVSLPALRGPALHPDGPRADPCARGRGPATLRPPADSRRGLQPTERRQAGPLHLPVLRHAARGDRCDDRPYRPQGPGRPVELDELRRRMRGVQRPQGRPDARASRHAATQGTGAARVEAALRPANPGPRAPPGGLGCIPRQGGRVGPGLMMTGGWRARRPARSSHQAPGPRRRLARFE